MHHHPPPQLTADVRNTRPGRDTAELISIAFALTTPALARCEGRRGEKFDARAAS
jgi:hypothetical protein